MIGRLIRQYKRVAVFFAVLAVTIAGLWPLLGAVPATLIGFDAAALAFFFAIHISWRYSPPEAMRQRAAENEPSHATMLSLAAVAFLAVLIAVVCQLGSGPLNRAQLALTSLTLITAWLFGNVLFAIHYAHAYYLEGNDPDASGTPVRGGLAFHHDGKGTETAPDFWDFTYFAFSIGTTTGATDVEVTGRTMRRVVLVHGLLAFIFNVVVAALAVSLIGDALKPPPDRSASQKSPAQNVSQGLPVTSTPSSHAPASAG